METYLDKNKKLKPSPNVKVLVSNSGTLLELRVTHVDITKEILSKFLDTVCDVYMISEEISKKKVIHFHCMIANLKLEYNDIEKFRERFKEKFPFLNSGHMYNLALVKNIDKYIAYILKEHDTLDSPTLIYKGDWNKEILDSLFVYKYKKFDKRLFMEEMEQIELEYIKLYKTVNPMKHEDLLYKLCQVRIKYNQTINWNYMCQFTEKIICKADPEHLKTQCFLKWEDYNYHRSIMRNNN